MGLPVVRVVFFFFFSRENANKDGRQDVGCRTLTNVVFMGKWGTF